MDAGGLHTRLSEYLFEVYDTIEHPALGRAREKRFGQESRHRHSPDRMIPYDQEFLMATLPATPRGTAKVMPGRGVKVNHVYYWSPASGIRRWKLSTFRPLRSVRCRHGLCVCGAAMGAVPFGILHCPPWPFRKKLMIASSELRRRQECHSQGLVITAKKLAGFLESVESDELLGDGCVTRRLKQPETP